MVLRIHVHHDPTSIEKVKLGEDELRADAARGEFFIGSFHVCVRELGPEGATLVVASEREIKIPADGQRHEFEVGGVPCEAWNRVE